MIPNRSRRNVLSFWVASVLAVLPTVSSSNDIPQPIDLSAMPESAEILKITSPNGEVVEYNTSSLETLGAFRVVQDSQWHGEQVVFDGVLLDDLLDAHGLSDIPAIRVLAEDGYAVTFLREGLDEAPILVATRINGLPMNRRSRGPFFFVINHDVVRDARHLGIQHHVWFAREIRVATSDEL